MTSRPITKDEHIMIMKTMNENHEGFFKRNPQIIHILTVECSTGIRLGDILRMKLADIYRTDKGYRLKIIEKKTGKERNVPVPSELYSYLTDYAMEHGRSRTMPIFDITVRAVNKYIRKVCIDYLEMEAISSHSWRKLFAHTVYEQSGNSIVEVKNALLHASVQTSMSYISCQSEKLEGILENNCNIVNFGGDD